MYFYKVHEHLIALINIMRKYICHIPHAPAPSIIPVLLSLTIMFHTKCDYMQFNLIFCCTNPLLGIVYSIMSNKALPYLTLYLILKNYNVYSANISFTICGVTAN